MGEQQDTYFVRLNNMMHSDGCIASFYRCQELDDGTFDLWSTKVYEDAIDSNDRPPLSYSDISQLGLIQITHEQYCHLQNIIAKKQLEFSELVQKNSIPLERAAKVGDYIYYDGIVQRIVKIDERYVYPKELIVILDDNMFLQPDIFDSNEYDNAYFTFKERDFRIVVRDLSIEAAQIIKQTATSLYEQIKLFSTIGNCE